MLTLLRKKSKAYAGRHANDARPPTGTECVQCGEKQLGVPESMLARCSVCEAWYCTGACFSLHRAPAAWYQEAPKRSWWKRAIGRG